MADKKYTSAELQEWLIQKATRTTDPRIARKILLSTDQRGRSTAMLGKLYLYKYDPLYGDRMTKYDKFPMCIPLRRYHNGFLGINLHYLGIESRRKFLRLLSNFSDGTKIQNAAKLDIDYDMLMASSVLENLTKPCVHRYIWGQCRSRFIQIYPDEFDKAAQLPVDDWVYNQRS